MAFAAALAGCSNAIDDREHFSGFANGTDDAGSAPPASDDATLEILATGAYRSSPEFTHVSSGPYPSTAVSGAFVDVWVSTDVYSDYAAITPVATGAGGALALGTVIVRAVSDANGDVTTLTLMRHGPVGINPTLDDWWFAETDANGVPLSDDAGPLTGALATCMTCHLTRTSDDFLFGVSATAR
jgi:hypothetical protein